MQLIFITGLPRSGTTWASKAIAAATKRKLVHEPFNWEKYPDRAEYHMKYLPGNSKDSVFIKTLRSSMKSRNPLTSILAKKRGIVIKDVHVCMAIEYVWAQLQPVIVILVRHPCALAQSWTNLGYKVHFRMDLLLSQKRLLQDYLDPFEAHMRSSNNYFFEVGAYWGASYFVLRGLAKKHKEWLWVTHEKLCVQPFAYFEQLLNKAGWKLNQSEKHSLRRFLKRTNREPRKTEGPYSLARVSFREPDKWRTRLRRSQIQAVIEGAEPFGILRELYE